MGYLRRTTNGLLGGSRSDIGNRGFATGDWAAGSGVTIAVSGTYGYLQLTGNGSQWALAKLSAIANRSKTFIIARIAQSGAATAQWSGPAAHITDVTAGSIDGVAGDASIDRSPERVMITEWVAGSEASPKPAGPTDVTGKDRGPGYDYQLLANGTAIDYWDFDSGTHLSGTSTASSGQVGINIAPYNTHNIVIYYACSDSVVTVNNLPTGATIEIQKNDGTVIGTPGSESGGSATVDLKGVQAAKDAWGVMVYDSGHSELLPAMWEESGDSFIAGGSVFEYSTTSFTGFDDLLDMIFDAADLSGDYSDGDPIDSWDEALGRATAVASGTARPTYKAATSYDLAQQPTVLFDGSNDYFSAGGAGAWGGSTGLTLFAIGLPGTPGGTVEAFWGRREDNGLGGATKAWWLAVTDGGLVQFEIATAADGSTSAQRYSDTELYHPNLLGMPAIIRARFNGGTGEQSVWVNGVNVDGTLTGSVPATIPLDGPDLRIGWTVNDFFAGHQGWLGAVPEALSDEECEAIEAILAARFGIRSIEHAASAGPIASTNQGFADDGTYYYTSTTSPSAALKKYDHSWSLQTSNTSPLSGLTGTPNHIGDISYYDGYIYASAEIYPGAGTSNWLLKYQASDLSRVAEESISYKNYGVAVDPDRGLLWLAADVGSAILYTYDLDTLAYVGSLAIVGDHAADWSPQGITYNPDTGLPYINHADGRISAVDPETGYERTFYRWRIDLEGEGTDFTTSLLAVTCINSSSQMYIEWFGAPSPAGTGPAQPTGLSATWNGASVDLAWTDNADNEDGYLIQWAEAETGPWTTIDDIAADSESYEDGTYGGAGDFYRVGAYNVAGTSWSAAAQVTMPPPNTPDTPTLVRIVFPADGQAHFYGSAFSAATGTHASTDWEIDLQGGDFSSPVTESLADAVNLTDWLATSGMSAGTQYDLRFRYRSDGGLVSAWAGPFTFDPDLQYYDDFTGYAVGDLITSGNWVVDAGAGGGTVQLMQASFGGQSFRDQPRDGGQGRYLFDTTDLGGSSYSEMLIRFQTAWRDVWSTNDYVYFVELGHDLDLVLRHTVTAGVPLDFHIKVRMLERYLYWLYYAKGYEPGWIIGQQVVITPWSFYSNRWYFCRVRIQDEKQTFNDYNIYSEIPIFTNYVDQQVPKMSLKIWREFEDEPASWSNPHYNHGEYINNDVAGSIQTGELAHQGKFGFYTKTGLGERYVDYFSMSLGGQAPAPSGFTNPRITSPVGGQVVDASLSVEWQTVQSFTPSGDPAWEYQADYDLSDDNWTQIFDWTAGETPYSWDTSGLTNGLTYRVRIRARDPGDTLNPGAYSISEPFVINHDSAAQFFDF